jgi:glycosyltransferase involved in cell wall biosynthesis
VTDRPADRDRLRVSLVLATSTGGVGQHVRSLAAGLIGLGHQVAVHGPADTERLFGFTGVGALFVPTPIAGSIGPRAAVTDVAAVTGLRRATRRSDVVHAHGLRAGMVAAAATVGRRGSSRRAQPLVVTWHNAILAGGAKARLLQLGERTVARAATLTLAASDDLVSRVLLLGGRDARLGAVAAPAQPAPTRSRDEVRAELGAIDGQPVVLSVGRLHPQKGFDVLVAAAARWAKRDPRPLVTIAGDGPARGDLAELIARTGAPVRLLGHREDVADLLLACDLAVVTSVWEARQLFAQEALRAGRPLVATAVGGLPGLVSGGAVLVPVTDKEATVAAVATAVERLLDDPGEAAVLAEKGQALAESWPTQEDTVAQVDAVYAELLGR